MVKHSLNFENLYPYLATYTSHAINFNESENSGVINLKHSN